MSLTQKQMAETLRGLADNLESLSLPVEIHSFEHYRDVTRPETGPMVVDAENRGRSIVIHVGDLAFANNGNLAKRLK